MVGRDPCESNWTARSQGDSGEHRHGRGIARDLFETWSYESDKPFSLEALREMVRRDLPASVYRCKGIVFIAESSTKRLALQAVGRRTEITELDDWGSRAPRTRIVAIGAPFQKKACNDAPATFAHNPLVVGSPAAGPTSVNLSQSITCDRALSALHRDHRISVR